MQQRKSRVDVLRSGIRLDLARLKCAPVKLETLHRQLFSEGMTTAVSKTLAEREGTTPSSLRIHTSNFDVVYSPVTRCSPLTERLPVCYAALFTSQQSRCNYNQVRLALFGRENTFASPC